MRSTDHSTTRPDPPTVGIVGGGIAGLASARYLAQRGAKVTVFEQGSIGNGSTGLAAGGIRTQFNRQSDIRMMIESVRVWETFEETFATDIRYRQAGYLMGIQDPDQVEAMEGVLSRQQAEGLDNRLLEPEEALTYCPGLNPDRFEGVAYGPSDGYADPHSALMGFRDAAEDAGAIIRTNCPVTGLRQQATGRVDGVILENETVSVDAVVNAAGAWAPKVAATVGLDLPIEPKARRAAMVEPDEMPVIDIPLVVDFGSGVYFRPFDDEQMLVGGHFEEVTAHQPGDEPDPTVDPAPKPGKSVGYSWQRTALKNAAECAAYFGPYTEVVDSWEGRYGMTPDENPIIERSLPGLYTAAGFSGHGMMMAPATGQLVADLVTDGESSLADPTAYSRERFDHTDSDSAEESEAISQF